MSKILEAELIVRARDLTGRVFEAIAGKAHALTQSMVRAERLSASLYAAAARADVISRRVERHGRAMTLGVTVPAALAARAVYHTIHDFELAGNKLKAFGDISEKELIRLKQIATEHGQKYQFGPTGVLKGMVEEIKAGFEPRHLDAIQKPLLDFATLAEIEVPRAAELAIFSIAGFGKMYDKTGKLLEAADLNKNLREMIDLFAILNKAAPGNIAQIADTFKYAAPIAKNVGVTPDQLGAFTAVLAQSGILGEEAGTALRSMLVRFIKPPQNAKAALSAAGLKFSDYVQINPNLLKPEAILSAVENFTGKVPGRKGRKFTVGAAPPAARNLFMKRLAALEGLEGDDYVKGLTAVIRKTAGGGLQDAKIAGDLATRIVGTAIEKIDVMRFLKDIFTKTANPSAMMSLFMDQRQGARLSNLDSERILYMLTQIEDEYRKSREGDTSPSAQMAGTINSGIIEAENRLRGAFERVKLAFSDPAILNTVATTFENIASVLKSIASTNPKVLEAATYAVAAAAVWGPAAMVLARLATIGGVLLKAGGWLLPGAAAAPSALAAGAGGGMLVGAGAAALDVIKRDAAGDNSLRSSLRGIFGIPDDKEPAPWLAGGAWDKHRSTIESVRDAVYGTGVKAELTGNAEITNKVVVEPSPDFLTRIETMISNSLRSITLNGAPPVGTAGSTGAAMPEALPASPYP